MSITGVNAFGAVAADEGNGHFLFKKSVCNRIDRFIAKIDVEYSGIQRRFSQRVHGVTDRSEWSNDSKSELAKARAKQLQQSGTSLASTRWPFGST